MSEPPTAIWIVDGPTGQPIEAALCHAIVERHVRDTEDRWRPWLEQVLAAQLDAPRPESAHWNWRRKVEILGGLLAYPSFAVECGGETQGLMILNTLGQCRLAEQAGKALVYIEYLETAPWNRLTPTRRYKRIGPALIDVAIQVSEQEGFRGRIGLHSLPQSDPWYRDRCGMADLGRDPQKQNLRYFEMTSQQANAFLGRRGI